MEDEEGLYECGMAGVGDALVCCKDCPEVAWYKENQPTRKIAYFMKPASEVYECPHGVKHERDEYCNLCLKEAMS